MPIIMSRIERHSQLPSLFNIQEDTKFQKCLEKEHSNRIWWIVSRCSLQKVQFGFDTYPILMRWLQGYVVFRLGLVNILDIPVAVVSSSGEEGLHTIYQSNHSQEEADFDSIALVTERIGYIIWITLFGRKDLVVLVPYRHSIQDDVSKCNTIRMNLDYCQSNVTEGK